MRSMSRIIRKATFQSEDKLNIITADTHEAYQTNMCKTFDNYYSIPHNTFKVWNSNFRPIPPNYIQLKNEVPFNVDFDIVVSQNKFGQFQVLSQVAKKLEVPLLSVEHTLPVPQWPAQVREGCKMMRGDINVFISEYSVDKWGFSLDDPTVRIIHHGIDTDIFKPLDAQRENKILCVVNDWINRDWCCNFNGFMRTASNLPCKIIGDTPGLSEPAKSVEDLVNNYSSHRIFYNTSTISPVPTALMEAMSCGCAIVSTATCMIPEVVRHGVDGFISNDEEELKKYLHVLLCDEELAKKMGDSARQRIIDKFGLSQFVDNWYKVLRECAGVIC